MVMTCFDDLSIDLLIKLFDYFSFIELFQAFFGLQKRLDNVIRNYSIGINLSQVLNYNIIQYFSFQCQSLTLSGIDLQSFQTKSSYLNFEALRIVSFKKMNLVTLYSFIEKLPMKQLESITIGRLTWHYYPIDFYKEIWSAIMDSIRDNRLRSLYLPYHIHHWDITKLSFNFSSLKHATLEYISVSQMLTFMEHTPNLRRFKACLTTSHDKNFSYRIILLHLNHLTLNLHDKWSFKQIHQLLTVCPHLKHLMLKLEARKEMKTMFEPSTWQILIEDKLPDLIFLRLHLNCIVQYSNQDYQNYQASFNHATYWLQREPHFQVTVYVVQREIFIS